MHPSIGRVKGATFAGNGGGGDVVGLGRRREGGPRKSFAAIYFPVLILLFLGTDHRDGCFVGKTHAVDLASWLAYYPRQSAVRTSDVPTITRQA